MHSRKFHISAIKDKIRGAETAKRHPRNIGLRLLQTGRAFNRRGVARRHILPARENVKFSRNWARGSRCLRRRFVQSRDNR